MTLYIIGIGLSGPKDITVRGLDAVKAAKRVFLESYTSKLNCSLCELEKFYGKDIIEADRNMVESRSDLILDEAKEHIVAFLVIGDALSATTHYDLVIRAKEKGVKVKIIQNASVLNAVGLTGLQLYKFGKTTSIPFPQKGFFPETAYDTLKENKSIGAHTLILLDLHPKEGKFMSAAQALSILKEIEEKRKECLIRNDMKVIVCCALGSEKQVIKYGKISDIIDIKFPEELQCMIFPGKLHFVEEDALKEWEI